jgi:hypothetical protein
MTPTSPETSGLPQDGLEALTRLLDPSHPVSPQAALRIRREVFGDGLISRVEADLLFDLADRVTHDSVDWTRVFVEAITDFVLNQEAPLGSISDSEADWLIGRMTGFTRALGDAEYELLVRLAERADATPERFQRFVLGAVAAVPSARGEVRALDVPLLRRVLFATGSDGASGITRWEADALFTLADRTAAGNNAPDWNDLFARAVGCHLMGLAARESTEAELARRDTWLNTRERAPDLFRQAFSGGLGAILQRIGYSAHADMTAQVEAEADALTHAALLDAAEVQWLQRRLLADGHRSAAEQALLAFLEREGAALPDGVRSAA